MDSDTLNTASTYLNNLLLARGLLRNGKPLDFAKPTRETRAQVINLVHELLLRRDRDQESREHVALTLRTLRTDETRKDIELEKFKTRMEEKDRGLLHAQAETRNMKLEMKRMESSMKHLQDQLAKLKASVGHIKTQCANDIRKRDTHIERLKTHLHGQQRGNKRGVVAPMVSVTGGDDCHSRFDASVRDLQDPEYSLKQETNEFLTQLGQSLSNENDGLITLLHSTLQTLRDLLGLDRDTTSTDSDGSMVSESQHDTSMAYDTEAAPISYDALTAELESTLEVLKSVLTSPNFVSMEEVESRDEEILRLREGWVMMEARWKEVLLMMNTWRTKMESTGDTVDLDDLKRGLGLGEGLDSLASAGNAAFSSPERVHVQSDSDRGSDEVHMTNIRGDSGIGHRSPPSVKGQSKGVLEPPELFHQKSAAKRHLRRLSPNLQSPRRVAFVESNAKSDSPSVRRSPIGQEDQSSATLASSMPGQVLAQERPQRKSTVSRCYHDIGLRYGLAANIDPSLLVARIGISSPNLI